MNREVDLTNCDREPIHIPGSVQPFGFLIALLSDFSICIASENVQRYLGIECADLLQRPVGSVLSETAVRTILSRVDYLNGPDAVERVFGVQLQADGRFSISRSTSRASISSSRRSRATLRPT